MQFAKYIAVFKLGLQNTFVYRWNYFLRAVFGLIPLAGTVFLWRAVFAEKGGGMRGYDYGSMIYYYLLMILVSNLVTPTEDEWQIASDIREGQINSFLTKPLSYLAYRFSIFLSGRLEERTIDWYTQDRQGNVWYFGESTAELDKKGHVTSTEGTWQAGREGARPGIYMPAHPKVGQTGRQEYYKKHAEDHFQVVRLHANVRAPYVTSKNALLTKEWTPLEPGVIDHKFYVRGIGTVLEQTVKGGDERNALVSVRRGG